MNYIGSDWQGPYFAFFVFVWIYLRHFQNLRIIYSIFNEFGTVGPYQLDWAAGQFKCLLSRIISSTLLGTLQSLNLFWLFFILRIAYRFVVQGVADDDRSDNEESEAEDENVKKNEKVPLVTGSMTNGHATNGAAKVNGTQKKRS